MQSRFLFYVISASLVLGGLFFRTTPAEAVTVGPPKIEISADPGTVYKDKLFLMNEEDSAKTFYPSFEKFVEVDGEKRFLPSEPTELANWFKIASKITLEPKEQRYIPFSIELPKNAPPGGHFAIIWWSTAPPSEKNGSSIVTRAGIVVYLRVSGDIQEKGSIRTFDVPGGGRLFSRLPESFSMVFKNEGNVHIKPAGKVYVRNIFGQEVASAAVNSAGLEILPQSERTFEPRLPSPGKFAFGIYTARAETVFGDSNQTATAKIIFVVIPWKFLSILLGIAALVSGGLVYGVKRYNRWIIERASAFAGAGVLPGEVPPKKESGKRAKHAARKIKRKK